MARNANPEYWQQILSDQSASGLTQVQWCNQKNVNIHNFRYWKGRLTAAPITENESDDTKWALITKPKTKDPQDQDESVIRIRIGKATVDVAADVDLDALASVISVLMQHVQ